LRWRHGAALLAAAGLVASGCTTGRVVSGRILSGGSTPLATTVNTASGMWAALPMGQLSDANNSYWQLLYRPNGSAKWTDHVDALATATTGGVNVGAGGSSLIAGVQAAQNLTFSPVIQTSDGGRTWHNGLLPSALARLPQALAVSPSGEAVAIVGAGGPHPRLELSSTANLASWSIASFGLDHRACQVAALNAARWVGSRFLIGTTCSQSGVAGVFDLTSGRWTGPNLPASDGTVPVVALAGGDGEVGALLVVEGKWVVASAGSGLNDWTESDPLTLDPAAIRSIVAEDGGGFFLLTDTSLAECPPGGQWTQLPAPPAGTATVGREAGGRMSALVVNGTTLTDWDLIAGTWVAGPVLQVPILYGSNS
jgi:hypothetical protein